MVKLLGRPAEQLIHTRRWHWKNTNIIDLFTEQQSVWVVLHFWWFRLVFDRLWTVKKKASTVLSKRSHLRLLWIFFFINYKNRLVYCIVYSGKVESPMIYQMIAITKFPFRTDNVEPYEVTLRTAVLSPGALYGNRRSAVAFRALRVRLISKYQSSEW